MLKDSILVSLTGNVDAFIYLLGFLELVVPVLLLISLVKRAFVACRKKAILEWLLFITIITFMPLSFVLSIISNYPGAANLIIYGAFTTLFYVMIKSDENDLSN